VIDKDRGKIQKTLIHDAKGAISAKAERRLRPATKTRPVGRHLRRHRRFLYRLDCKGTKPDADDRSRRASLDGIVKNGDTMFSVERD